MKHRTSLVTLVYHLVALTLCAYYLYRAELVFGHPNAKLLAFGGRYAFLTQLTHTALTIYFGFMVLYDLRHFMGSSSTKIRQKAKSSAGKKRLNRLNDYLTVLLFVFTSLVGIMFWAIFFYDQELILPKNVEKYYPYDLNLFQHGIVMLLMWLEVVVCAHKNRSLLGEAALILALGLGYLLWTALVVQLNGGVWPYAFQKDMDVQAHVIFNLVGALMMIVALLLSRAARAVLHGASAKAPRSKPAIKSERKKQK